MKKVIKFNEKEQWHIYPHSNRNEIMDRVGGNVILIGSDFPSDDYIEVVVKTPQMFQIIMELDKYYNSTDNVSTIPSDIINKAHTIIEDIKTALHDNKKQLKRIRNAGKGTVIYEDNPLYHLGDEIAMDYDIDDIPGHR